ncbi:seryl-tRNA synthetase [Balneicella halophila]|uniref:Serine--tRNA ligase n=1 Tax=Balneicella halophila TaxID=1537566 RepID=A0A7L4URW5_BALHA|nr:serine--tRNA ligase [Balneicella halophila]PVX52525.1 seryl-tRNA synthetase [Balneicella halophila]
MLELKNIIANSEKIIEALKIKNVDVSDIVAEIVDVDAKRRTSLQQLEEKQAFMNSLSKEIGQLFREGKTEEANNIKAKTANLKTEIAEHNDEVSNYNQRLEELLIQLPNIPHPSVPAGKTDADNIIEKDCLNVPETKDDMIPHWDLLTKYDIVDFELGTKITGAGFPVYKGKGAALQRALISFFLDENIKAGYEEVLPPIVVNEDSAYGTGQLPDKEGQMYHVTGDNLYLIPTAEVPVTNIYRDVILQEENLPKKNTAYTPCFRREAGSYGKDVRGLNRLHQFDKVEVVQVAHPDKSYEILNEMVAHVEAILIKLELPYRILRLCGGDLSFTSALTFDFEVYSVAQKRWLEVSSVSNFESYQANRLKLRFKSKNSKGTTLAHTLNGSALALPRIMAALLENNQTEKGIRIPDALVPYTRFDLID